MGPDFLILGAAKCGTTALWSYLNMHPQIQPAKKEMLFLADNSYFEDLQRFQKVVSWYFSRFKAIGKLQFEATPNYLFHPPVAERVKRLLTCNKFIVMLRNPVDRAYSHYHHNKDTGWLSCSFEETLAKEDEILKSQGQQAFENMTGHFNNERTQFEIVCIKSRGLYAEQLKRWFSHFQREQFLIIKTEEMKQDTRSTMNEVERFLGLDATTTEFEIRPSSVDYKSMLAETRDRLVKFFEPHNRELCDLLEKDFDWK